MGPCERPRARGDLPMRLPVKVNGWHICGAAQSPPPEQGPHFVPAEAQGTQTREDAPMHGQNRRHGPEKGN